MVGAVLEKDVVLWEHKGREFCSDLRESKEGFPVAGESEPQRKSIFGQGVEITVLQTKGISCESHEVKEIMV